MDMFWKNRFWKLFFGLFFLAVAAGIYIELTRFRGELQFLSSKDITDAVVSMIQRKSILYIYFILYIIFLVSYCFVQIFRMLIGTSVSGKAYKVAAAVLIYVAGIALAIPAYNRVLFADNILQKAGYYYISGWNTLIMPALMVVCCILAQLVKRSMAEDILRRHRVLRHQEDVQIQKLDTLRGLFRKNDQNKGVM